MIDIVVVPLCFSRTLFNPSTKSLQKVLVNKRLNEMPLRTVISSTTREATPRLALSWPCRATALALAKRPSSDPYLELIKIKPFDVPLMTNLPFSESSMLFRT